MKHFPTFKMKFTPDAIAHTVAPSRWGVLLSQRRRWINSTVHNLAELLFLPELCGFCFFSMRFVVFIDLLGTIVSGSMGTGMRRVLIKSILDSSCHLCIREWSLHNSSNNADHIPQLIYLIVIVSIGKAAIPVISLVMIAAVYGLQVSGSPCLASNLRLTLASGHHLHPPKGVHVDWMDVRVHTRVRSHVQLAAVFG